MPPASARRAGQSEQSPCMLARTLRQPWSVFAPNNSTNLRFVHVMRRFSSSVARAAPIASATSASLRDSRRRPLSAFQASVMSVIVTSALRMPATWQGRASAFTTLSSGHPDSGSSESPTCGSAGTCMPPIRPGFPSRTAARTIAERGPFSAPEGVSSESLFPMAAAEGSRAASSAVRLAKRSLVSSSTTKSFSGSDATSSSVKLRTSCNSFMRRGMSLSRPRIRLERRARICHASRKVVISARSRTARSAPEPRMSESFPLSEDGASAGSSPERPAAGPSITATIGVTGPSFPRMTAQAAAASSVTSMSTTARSTGATSRRRAASCTVRARRTSAPLRSKKSAALGPPEAVRTRTTGALSSLTALSPPGTPDRRGSTSAALFDPAGHRRVSIFLYSASYSEALDSQDQVPAIARLMTSRHAAASR